MKKVTLSLSFLLLAVSFLLPIPSAKASGEVVVDTEFVPGYNYYTLENVNPPLITSCSRFTPTRSSYTNYVDMAVKNSEGANFPMEAQIRPNSGNAPEANRDLVIKKYIQSTFNNYAMGTDKPMSRFVANDQQAPALTVGTVYWICISDAWVANSIGWFYSSGGPGSFMSLSNTNPTARDDITFGYRTFAYENSNDSPGQNSGTSTDNSTANSGVAPSSRISNSIAVPTNLAASYSSANKKVTLTWTASATTTIGGYNIYRSESAGKDYVKIGDSGKTTTTTTDASITAGKTYYYMVRAYKDTYESANSNEASVKIPSNNLAVTSAATQVQTPWYYNQLIWILGGLLLILSLLLILLIIRRKKSKKKSIINQSAR